jgi:hypothetical protein
MLAALTRHLDAFDAAELAADRDGSWIALRDALGWIHKLQELDRKVNPVTYYITRGHDPAGQTMGGLVWVRGLADHHQAELRQRDLLTVRVYVAREDGVLVDSRGEPFDQAETDRRAAEAFRHGSRWPSRGDLPEPPASMRPHDRDRYYDERVAGRPLADPLREVQRYLSSIV